MLNSFENDLMAQKIATVFSASHSFVFSDQISENFNVDSFETIGSAKSKFFLINSHCSLYQRLSSVAAIEFLLQVAL